MKILIHQSNYIPWKGYFDLINMADVFVIYDHVQYTKNDWRNRNLIKTPAGVNWLTIAVRQERLNQSIRDTEVSWTKWNSKHWKTITANYAQASHFKHYKDLFEDLYLGCQSRYLSEINLRFIEGICGILKIDTKIISSLDLTLTADRNDNLISICEQLGAETYISGPSAQSYLDVDEFEKRGIKVEWMSYEGYPQYRQRHPPFEHGVSVIDLIFNEGQNATEFMKSFL